MPETQHDASNEATSPEGNQDGTLSGQGLSDGGGLQALLKLGTKAYADHDYKAAADFLERVLAKDPEQWKALICLGLSYFHLKEFSKAQSAFATIVTQCPQEDIVVRAVQAMDKVNAALAASGGAQPERSAGPERSHADTGVYLGLNKSAGEGEYDPQATGAFQKKELPQAEREKMVKWGINCYLDNKYEKAVEYLEAGLSGEDENWNARLTLGMSYYKLGQYNLAEIVVNSILSGCNDQKMILRAKQALENIKVSGMQVDEKASEAFENALAAKAAHKAEVAEQKKLHTQQQQKALAAEHQAKERERVRERRGVRHGHPAAVPIFILVLTGLAYYCAAQALPGIYSAALSSGAKGGGVASLGLIDNIAPKELVVPGPNASKIAARLYEKPGATRVVILHPGGFDDAAMRKSLTEALLQAGVSVCVYDNRGTGGSTGPSSWAGIVDDGLFVYDYLHGKLGYKGASDIISYGCSMGAASSLGAGQMRPHLSVIAENPFVSVPHMMRLKNPALGLFPDGLCPEPFYDFYKGNPSLPPVLVISSKDPIVPAGEAEALLNKIGGTKEQAQISTPPTSPHWDTIVKFATK